MKRVAETGRIIPYVTQASNIIYLRVHKEIKEGRQADKRERKSR